MTDRWVIMRHARSLGNEDYTLTQRIRDQDIPLSLDGHIQAIEAAAILAQYASTLAPEVTCFHFHHSPYLRAVDTMVGLAAALTGQFNVTSIAHPDLHEKKMGKFEGYSLAELERIFGQEATDFLREYNDPSTKMSAKPPDRRISDGASHDHDGESYAEAILRARRFVREKVLPHQSPSGTLNVVVGHGRFNTFVEKEMLGLPDDYYLSISIPDNAGFKVFERAQGIFVGPVFAFNGYANAKERVTDRLQPRPSLSAKQLRAGT